MPHLNIRIHRCNEKEPAWPDQQLEGELQFDKCTIIEQGMSSGEPSLAFTLVDPATGKEYMAQTSVGILDMIQGALNGARAHWKENPVKNIWK